MCLCLWLRMLTVAEVPADDDRECQQIKASLFLGQSDSHSWSHLCSLLPRVLLKRGDWGGLYRRCALVSSPFTAGLNCCSLKPALEVDASGIMLHTLTLVLLWFSVLFSFFFDYLHTLVLFIYVPYMTLFSLPVVVNNHSLLLPGLYWWKRGFQ